MLEEPYSVENQTIEERDPYISYLPGSVIPVYAIAKIFKLKPTHEMVMRYNLLNHFLIAFLLSLIVFIFLLSLKLNTFLSFAFSVIPIFLYLLMPGPLYWHQNVYFADQAVILPFTLYILTEILQDISTPKRSIKMVKLIIMFWGMFTEPSLFFFIIIFSFIIRLLNRDQSFIVRIKQNIILYLLPLSITGLLYLYISISLNRFSGFIDTILYRFALNVEGNSESLGFVSKFWEGYFSEQYGFIGIALILGSLVFLIISVFILTTSFLEFKKTLKDKLVKLTSLSSLIILPCLAQIYTMRNHSVIHDFSVMKFSVAMSLLVFVFVPILAVYILTEIGIIKRFLQRLRITETKIFSILWLICISVSIYYISLIHQNYLIMFPKPDKDIENIGKFIYNNTKFEDIVFSPDFRINQHPPQLLSYSRKRVYKIQSLAGVKNKIDHINGDYVINLFIKNSDEGRYPFGEIDLISYSSIRENGMRLYKIKEKIFRKINPVIFRKFSKC